MREEKRKGKVCSVPKRDKKAFLSEQCKEIEENNRQDQRSLKIRDTKETLHVKMGSIKDRNC